MKKIKGYLGVKLKILLSIIILQGCAGYNVNIAGVSTKNFKGRDWKEIAVGAVSSLVVHELGHMIIARTNGGVSFDWSERTVIFDDYWSHSHNTQQWFHRSGFVSQLIVGSVLTAIEDTRHTDFVLGFNSFTTINTAIYTLTGGINKEYSDIENLDHGTIEGSLYTIGAGILTIENLRR